MTPEAIVAAARRKFYRCRSVRITSDYKWSSSLPVEKREVSAIIVKHNFETRQFLADNLTALHALIQNEAIA